jgi:predicted PurR-regulated permease PerM
MLGIDRRAAHYTWTAVLVVLGLWLVYAVRTTLFVFVLALLFAYLLSPLVNFLDYVLPSSRTRTPALALAYVIFVAIVILIGSQIGSRVVEEANSLAGRLPAMLQEWEKPSPAASSTINSIKQQVIGRVQAEIAQRSTAILEALPKAGLKALSVASNVIYLVIIPILGFFFLKDGGLIRQHILDMLAEGPRRALLDDVMDDIHLLLAHYMRALVLLSLAGFTAYSIFFSIIGVPYAILLAALGGMLEFIPMVGPLAASLTILVVAGVSGSHVVAVLIFLLVYRMFQDYVLSPHLMGQGVELHPLLVLFGVFAGAEVAGIPGTFLSVPVLALARVLYVRVRKARLSARLAPASTVRA